MTSIESVLNSQRHLANDEKTAKSGRAVHQRHRFWSCNEWDPLKEVIVGTVDNARFPFADPSTLQSEYAGRSLESIPAGAFPEEVIEETREDLERLVETLEQHGVVVSRPALWPHHERVSNPYWDAEGFYNYCPRDVFLVVGDTIIETPNAIRGRYFETFAYRDQLLDYCERGARWISAPKPQLMDNLFNKPPARLVPNNHEPVFDAANVLRLGDDLVYLISSTGNEMGARWLQSVLGDSVRVHTCEIDYFGSHIDTSIVALRPGLLLCNPERVRKSMLPSFLKDWEVIFSPELIDPYSYDQAYRQQCLGSGWMGMNLLSIDAETVIVDRHQTELIKLLERHHIKAVPLELRHARMLGGGFHCVTLDICRMATP